MIVQIMQKCRAVLRIPGQKIFHAFLQITGREKRRLKSESGCSDSRRTISLIRSSAGRSSSVSERPARLIFSCHWESISRKELRKIGTGKGTL